MAESMSLGQLTAALRRLGLRPRVQDGRLVWPAGIDMPLSLRPALALHHDQLVAALRETPPPRAPRPAGGPAWLTPAQSAMLFMEQAAPGTGLFNIPLLLLLEGEVDASGLQLALEAVVRRHRILGCRWRLVEGRPYWDESPTLGLEFQVVDVADRPEAEQQSLLDEAVVAARREVFGDKAWISARLYRRGRLRWCLLLNRHHLVSDGWSFDLLCLDLSRAYVGLLRGAAAELPPLRLQFHDHCRTLTAQPACDTALVERVAVLADAPRRVQWPGCAAARPEVAAVQVVRFRLAHAVRLALESGRSRHTPFATGLAALGLVLAATTTQRDMVVGIDTTGRDGPDEEQLIGLFVNRAAIRLQPGALLTACQYLEAVQMELLAVLARRHLPFSQLARRLAPQDGPRLSPLFNVMFGLHNSPRQGLDLGHGLSVRTLALGHEGVSELDFSLYLTRDAEGYQAELLYRPELLDRERAALWFDAWCAAVVALVDQPAATLQSLQPDRLPGPREDVDMIAAWEALEAARSPIGDLGEVSA